MDVFDAVKSSIYQFYQMIAAFLLNVFPILSWLVDSALDCPDGLQVLKNYFEHIHI